MKNRPLFQQDIALLMEADLLDRRSYLRAYGEASTALTHIERRAENGEYAFLEEPFLPLDRADSLVKKFQNFHMIFVMGTPATTVTVKAMTSLFQSWVWVDGARPRICFLDHEDPEVFWEIMSVANPLTTGVIVFDDVEDDLAILHMMRCLEYWQGMLNPSEVKSHFLVISSRKGVIQKISDSFGLPRMEGRPFSHGSNFTCFSLPSLIPAMIGGFNAEKFNRGAALTCSQFFRRQLKIPLEGASLLWSSKQTYGLSCHLLHPVGQVFHYLTLWMRQLWGTFLKEPPYSLVTEPVHNARHFVTVFFEQHVARERLNPDFWSHIPEVRSFAHTALEEATTKSCDAFCSKKIQEGHLLRIIRVNALNEETLGALFMNHILEILIINELSRRTS
jgi:hypothetical protein